MRTILGSKAALGYCHPDSILKVYSLRVGRSVRTLGSSLVMQVNPQGGRGMSQIMLQPLSRNIAQRPSFCPILTTNHLQKKLPGTDGGDSCGKSMSLEPPQRTVFVSEEAQAMPAESVRQQ